MLRGRQAVVSDIGMIVPMQLLIVIARQPAFSMICRKIWSSRKAFSTNFRSVSRVVPGSFRYSSARFFARATAAGSARAAAMSFPSCIRHVLDLELEPVLGQLGAWGGPAAGPADRDDLAAHGVLQSAQGPQPPEDLVLVVDHHVRSSRSLRTASVWSRRNGGLTISYHS